jgi:hypothetical protein
MTSLFTLAFWEHLSVALLVIPSVFTCSRLWRAFAKEQSAKRAKSQSDARILRSEARQIAGVASLFSFWVLLSFTIGLGLQLILLAIKVFLPAT